MNDTSVFPKTSTPMITFLHVVFNNPDATQQLMTDRDGLLASSPLSAAEQQAVKTSGDAGACTNATIQPILDAIKQEIMDNYMRVW